MTSLAARVGPGREAAVTVGKLKQETSEEVSRGMTGATLSALPACAEKADQALVDRVALQIRTILKDTVVRGTEEVGQFLLREFFNNDPNLYASASHSKHASLRMLEDRCDTLDLPVRRSFLGNALRVAVLARRLPAESAFHRLPSSHRVELLRVRDLDKLESLAQAAYEKRLSVQKIRAAARKEKDRNKSNRGRKPIPAIVKLIKASVENLRDDATGRLRFRRAEVDALTEDQLTRAQEMASTLSKRVEELLLLLG